MENECRTYAASKFAYYVLTAATPLWVDGELIAVSPKYNSLAIDELNMVIEPELTLLVKKRDGIMDNSLQTHDTTENDVVNVIGRITVSF